MWSFEYVFRAKSYAICWSNTRGVMHGLRQLLVRDNAIVRDNKRRDFCHGEVSNLVRMNRMLDRQWNQNLLRDCPDVLSSANFRRGEPGKPQLIVRRAQAPPVPSFRVTHCLAGLVRSVILFYLFIYLDFYVILMFYNVVMNITKKGILLSLFLRYLSMCPLYRLSTLVVVDHWVVDVMIRESLSQALPQ